MALIGYTITVVAKQDNPYNVLPETDISIRKNSDNSLVNIYADEAGLIPIPQLGAKTDSNGQFTFYADASLGVLKAVWTNGGVTSTEVLDQSDHSRLVNRNAVGAHDAIYRRETTVSEIATGVFSVGDKLTVTDRGGAKFTVSNTGSVNGMDILDAGVGRVAVLDNYFVLNVMYFGAVADHVAGTGSSTDNSPMINRALTLSASKGGLPVYAPSSRAGLNYRCNTAIVINASTDFYGDGIQSSIEYFGSVGIEVSKNGSYSTGLKIRNMKLVRRGASGVSIDVSSGTVTDPNTWNQDLVIDGVRSESAQIAFRVAQSRNVTLKNLTGIHNDEGILFTGQVVVGKIEGCDIIAGLGSLTYGARLSGNTNFSDAGFRRPENIQIKHNRFFGYDRQVIVDSLLYGSIYKNDLDATISRGVDVFSATDLTIEGNWVDIIGGTTNSVAINLSDGVAYDPANDGVTVVGNKLRSSDSSGWVAVRVGSYRRLVKVQDDNKVTTGFTYGVYTEVNTQFITIKDNMLGGAGTSIYLSTGTDEVDIVGNYAPTMSLNGATSVDFGPNMGTFTGGVVAVEIPAGATSATITLPSYPVGCLFSLSGSSIGGASRGNIRTRYDGGTQLTVSVDTAFGVADTVYVKAAGFKV